MSLDPNVQLILGGFDSAAKGLQPTIDQERAEAARNRPLSGYEKWLGKVLSGELSPEQAATHAKLEQQNMLPAEPQQGVAAPMGGLSANANAVSNMAMPSEASQPQRISQVSGPVAQSMPQSQGGLGSGLQAPQTAGDMQALMGAAPFLRAANQGRQMTPEELAFKIWRENQITGRTGMNIGSRENIAGNKLGESGRQFDANLQYKYDALNALNQRAARLQQLMSNRAGAANDLALLRAQTQRLNGAMNALSRIEAAGTAYMSPQVQAQADQLRRESDAALQDVMQLNDLLEQKYSPGQPQATGAPSNTVQTNVSTVQSGQGPVAPAAPARGRLNQLFGK